MRVYVGLTQGRDYAINIHKPHLHNNKGSISSYNPRRGALLGVGKGLPTQCRGLQGLLRVT